MDDEQKAKIENDMALRRREMQRFSQDIIRVFNPLEIDFRFYFDGYPNTVKARSYKDLERFKARLFVDKISEYIIGGMAINKGEDLLKKRKDRGLDEILDKYQENRQIWDKTPQLNDPTLREQIAGEVLIGLVEEYGKDTSLPDTREQPKPDTMGLSEALFKKLTKKRVDKELPEPKELPKVEPTFDTPVKPLKKKGENE